MHVTQKARKLHYDCYPAYRAKVKDERNSKVGRWAWDVYLLTQH